MNTKREIQGYHIEHFMSGPSYGLRTLASLNKQLSSWVGINMNKAKTPPGNGYVEIAKKLIRATLRLAGTAGVPLVSPGNLSK